MKLYIIITYDIHLIGGTQAYTAAKASALERHGWDVKILYSGYAGTDFVISSLKKYEDGAIYGMSTSPFLLTEHEVQIVIQRMIKALGDTSGYDTIYMESHYDRSSQWGELVAEKIGARHIVLTLNERFRGQDRYYLEKLDFYDFKYSRGELRGSTGLRKLYEGIREISKADERPFWINESPVQEVNHPKIEELTCADWTICTIGRFDKNYIPAVLSGVRKFADCHSDRRIQFVIVGETGNRWELLRSTFENSINVELVELGNLSPIPRSLFGKVDVVIACSGSARCSVVEGVPTIVADAERKLAIGVLGYETQNSIFWDGSSPLTRFDEALERVLVTREYLNLPYKYKGNHDMEACYQQNMEVFRSIDQTREYYDAEQLCSGKKDYYFVLKWRLKNHLYEILPDLFLKYHEFRRKTAQRGYGEKRDKNA